MLDLGAQRAVPPAAGSSQPSQADGGQLWHKPEPDERPAGDWVPEGGAIPYPAWAYEPASYAPGPTAPTSYDQGEYEVEYDEGEYDQGSYAQYPEPDLAEPLDGQATEPMVEPVLMLAEPLPQPSLSPIDQPFTPSDRPSLVTDACPYLRSADGLWRSAVSERDLRCWGSAPPLPLAPQTQDRLCRTPAHVRCEIFLDAQNARVSALAADRVSPQQLDGRFGLLVRPTPLILDRPVSLAAALPSRKPRTLAGIAVAALAALVLAIVLVALLQGGGIAPATPTPFVAVGASPSGAQETLPAGGSSPSPSLESTPPPTSTAPPTPSPSASTSATEPTETVGPDQSLPAGVARTYRVHKGDTLASIGQKFGVTPKQILAVNDLGDPPRLLFGQVINIPFPSTPTQSPAAESPPA